MLGRHRAGTCGCNVPFVHTFARGRSLPHSAPPLSRNRGRDRGAGGNRPARGGLRRRVAGLGQARRAGQLQDATPPPEETAGEEEADLAPRPKVVEAVAPGQEPQSAPESSAPSASEGGDDNVSPGAASDDDIRADLKDLGDDGGGADRAVLRPDGQAIAPVTAPPEVKLIIEAGNEIAKHPYKWGGGHGKWLDNGYDCSGSVSYALAAGGLVESSLVSGDYARWGSKGRGKWITVFANGGHVYMEVAGLRFDTSGRSSRLGSRWQAAGRGGGGFAVRHPARL